MSGVPAMNVEPSRMVSSTLAQKQHYVVAYPRHDDRGNFEK
jgi:hypothetical protein